MLLNIDAKQLQLEWVTAVYLSQDEVGIKEILEGFDQHEDNKRRFGLPSRIIAKVLLFRTIYGGSGYSFANDPEFSSIGGESWWDEAITKFYAKYQGLYAWHERLYKRVVLDNGRLEMETGRVYDFPRLPNRHGEVKYSRTKILNYPVQGLAADLMSIARVSLFKRLKPWLNKELLLVNTVHDSIILDISQEVWDNIGIDVVKVVYKVFEDIPSNYQRLFGVKFNLPVRCEVTYGLNWKEMKEITL